ncbi:hypothetical protein HDV57DRAFT_422881 [Trichoderma longibrachiatum]
MGPFRRISIMVKHSGIPQRSSARAFNTSNPGRRECTGTNSNSGTFCISRMLLTAARLPAYNSNTSPCRTLGDSSHTQGEKSVLLAASPIRGMLFYICVVASHDITGNSHRVYSMPEDGDTKPRSMLEDTCRSSLRKQSSPWARPGLRNTSYFVDPCHSQHSGVVLLVGGEDEYIHVVLRTTNRRRIKCLNFQVKVWMATRSKCIY